MKKGCIKINKATYENDWRLVSHIFREFKPHHMEYDHVKEVWTFTGTCDSFDEVAEHEPAPEYRVTYHRADGLHISFRRAETPQYTGPGLMPLVMQIIKDELQKEEDTYKQWKGMIETAIRSQFWFLYPVGLYSVQQSASAADQFLKNLINSK